MIIDWHVLNGVQTVPISVSLLFFIDLKKNTDIRLSSLNSHNYLGWDGRGGERSVYKIDRDSSVNR